MKLKQSAILARAIIGCVCVMSFCPVSKAQGDPSGAFAGQVPVSAYLKKVLSSKDSKVGQEISAVTEQAATIGTTILPKGSVLLGHVVEVNPHTKDAPNGSVSIVFDHAQPKKGDPFEISCSVYRIALSADQARAQPTDLDMGIRSLNDQPLATQNAEHNTGLLHQTVDGMTSKPGEPVHVVSAVPGVALSAVASDTKSAILTSRNHDVFLDKNTELIVGVKLK